MTTDQPGRVVCIGECMVEFFDAGGGNWRRGFAGDTMNVAWALRAILPSGYAVDYVTRVGTDEISNAMVAFLAQAGLGTDAIQRDPARTVGLYTITVDGRGERSFSYWRSASAARQLATDQSTLDAAFAGADLLYLSGITAAVIGVLGRDVMLSALAKARKAGARVAFDPNYRPRLWESPDAMRAFAPRISELADIVLPTFDDEVAGFGDASPSQTANRLGKWGCPEIVVKNGTEPTMLVSGGTRTLVAVDHPVRPVDTTGAGDSFNGAYLAARLTGLTPVAAVRHAQAVSAQVVTERGALLPPDRLRAAYGTV